MSEEEGVSLSGRRSRPQWLAEADAQLIESVRARPVLYDCRNKRYSDNQLKASIWAIVGRQLKLPPQLCKNRWNNIRDNYRKGLKRGLSGNLYKYSGALSFLDRFLVQKVDKKGKEEDSNDAEDAEEVTDTQPEIDTSYIKLDINEDQSEPLIDYEMFEGSSSSAKYPAQAQAVEAFLGALAPPLKELSPYLLSLAKAELFAVVHKYEMRGLRERGLGEDDPLP